MRRILTLLVLALLIAAVPQATFAKVKKTKKTPKTTKTTKTIKKSIQTTSKKKSNYSTTKKYSQSAPEYRIDDDDNRTFAETGYFCFGKDSLGICFEFFKSNLNTIRININIKNFNFNLKGKKYTPVSVSFSDGTVIKGYSRARIKRDSDGLVELLNILSFYLLEPRNIIYLNLSMDYADLGNSTSPAKGTIEHSQYISKLFMNHNITKIVLDNDLIIPIDQSKWGSKHTFYALTKAVAEKTGNYEVFGLNSPKGSTSYNSKSNSLSTKNNSSDINISSSKSSSSTRNTSSSTSYSSPSSHSTSGSSSYNSSGYYRSSHGLHWGNVLLTAGYIQRHVISDDSYGDWWSRGLQVGLDVDWYWRKGEEVGPTGIGLNTGFYYEYHKGQEPWVPHKNIKDGEFSENFHFIYMPVHLQWRWWISNKFQIFVNGGVGLDYACTSRSAPRSSRLNTSLEYGGGIFWGCAKISATRSIGITNNSEKSATTKANKFAITLGIGFGFK